MSATFVFNHAHLAQRKQLRALFLQLAGMFTAVGLMTFFIAHLGLGLRGAAVAGVITQYAIFALQVGSARQLGRAGGLRVSFRKARWATMRGLFSRLGPLGLMYITKTAALCVITAAAAVTGLQHAAAHQAMWPIFICCSFLNYPMETAILAFIPAARTPKGQRVRKDDPATVADAVCFVLKSRVA